jgi:hypothetical protein
MIWTYKKYVTEGRIKLHYGKFHDLYPCPYTAVGLKLFWFAAHCKTYKHFLAHFVYKIKNI